MLYHVSPDSISSNKTGCNLRSHLLGCQRSPPCYPVTVRQIICASGILRQIIVVLIIYARLGLNTFMEWMFDLLHFGHHIRLVDEKIRCSSSGHDEMYMLGPRIKYAPE